MMSSELLLSARGIGLKYTAKTKLFKKAEDFWPFRGLDFDLFRGETLGVWGRNGAGKSTLMRIIAGIMEPDEGTLEISPTCRSIQLLTTKLGFERILTGRENAIMSGLLLGKSKAYMTSKVHQVQEFSELGDFFDRPVYSYSSGMVARLAFSIALQTDPDVLLIDETLGVGDRAFREKSSEAIKEMVKSDTTVVLVSHNKDAMDSLCDRIVYMDKQNKE